ncbi:MAG: hypothetical protein SFX73_24930 [Kofleriaceae bacterium]|nr:hypothetical protein [Kofleriaceae bacterium]
MRSLFAIALVAGARMAAGEPAVASPDPAASRVGEANLESLDKRQGMTFGAMVGPSLTFGSDVGTGGALTLRMGQVATPSTVMSLELNAAAVFHRVEDRLVANNTGSLLAGVQYWVNPSLFVRAAAGFGNYHCKECGAPDADGMRRTDKYAGVAGSVGAGIDVVRWGRLVLSFEVHSVTLFTLDGMLSNNALGLAIALD